MSAPLEWTSNGEVQWGVILRDYDKLTKKSQIYPESIYQFMN